MVILSYRHESDATSQKIAQKGIQRIGRASSARLNTDVMQQRGRLCFLIGQVSEDEVLGYHWTSDPWDSKSIVVMGKTAGFTTRALELGFPFDLHNKELHASWAKLMTAACNVTIIDHHGDKGSTNLPAYKHITDKYFDEIPCTINDVTNCELHVVQVVKNSVAEVKDQVGGYYCMSNQFKNSSFIDTLIAALEWQAAMTVYRICSPAPASVQGDFQLLIDKLFNLKGRWHQRGHPADGDFEMDPQEDGNEDGDDTPVSTRAKAKTKKRRHISYSPTDRKSS